MKFILGKKIGMSQVFITNGKYKKVVPISVVEAEPCVVTQVKTIEKDGYGAVQVGFSEKKKLNKPMGGHLKNLGKFRHLREFRVDEKKYKVGDKIDVSVFKTGDKVKVMGTAKAKGFQGVMKRHNFRGGPGAHGQKHSHRKPGSLASKRIGKVAKGKRMAGRMGGGKRTQVGLEIVEIDKNKNLLLIKGSVPGNPQGLLKISEE